MVPWHQEDAEHWRRELERLRAQLEAELKAAREEAERQRLRAEEPGNGQSKGGKKRGVEVIEGRKIKTC